MLLSLCGWDHLWILLVWQIMIIHFLTFLVIFRQFSLHATSLTFWLWLGPPVDSAPLCSSLTEPRRPPVALRPPQRQHVPPALIIARICHGSKIGFVSKVICGFVTAGCRHFSLSYLCLSHRVTCSVGNGTDWKSNVAMTVMMVKIFLAVMTTSVITLPRVFGGEVSVSRHFKGDIFSQEGENFGVFDILASSLKKVTIRERESWWQFWWWHGYKHKTIHIWPGNSHRLSAEKKKAQ